MSTKAKVKITFRIVEFHTIEREVDAADLEFHDKAGDTAAWLENEFRDDPMPDSDICTDFIEIYNYEDPSDRKGVA